MDEIKKVLLFGVGAVASTYEKSVEVIDELVKKGKITVEEGKELGEELKRTFNDKCKTEGKNKYYETKYVKHIIVRAARRGLCKI